MDITFILLVVLLLFILFVLAIQRSRLDKELNLKKEDVSNLKSDLFHLSQKNHDIEIKLSELKKRNSELEVYSTALDADREAQQRLEQAKSQADTLLLEANLNSNKILEQAYIEKEKVQSETNEIRKSNRDLINTNKENADRIKRDAIRQAKDIISNAQEKAKQIAGSAYEIAEKAEHYENVVKSMKNIIEGYGDEYLKPTFSILDDLAVEFGFDEAGQNLKEAREKTKFLIINGEASKCDYAEKYRKTTAENFVLDAFNGKVDTILSLIKKDNYGVLEQKIKDAYFLVNNLGKAFRNAHVTSIYLESRLDELKWGVAVYELKLKDKEEQRRIKEQIREEEKARREYEKAIKEAAKEEDAIKKAMEKARLAIEKATEEQRIKYEQQLSELQIKLEEAEAKNQRALSMAQQTKSGHVYIISNIGSFGDNVFKIGMTRRLEPMDRVRELGDASVPFPFDVHAMIYSDDAPGLETELHKYFVQNQVNKVNPRKEFFRVPISDIRTEVDKRGLDVKWTMTAAALEYKETLAIEKSLINDDSARDKWLKQQENINKLVSAVDDDINE